MRMLLGLLLLAAAASAEGKLRDVLDPDSVALDPYGWDEWRKLPREKQLESRGIEPEGWKEPPPPEKKKDEPPPKPPPAAPPAPPGPPQDPDDRWPGFQFGKRLAEKQKQFDGIAQNLPPSSIEGLVGKLGMLDKIDAAYEKRIAELTDEFLGVKEQLDRIAQQQTERYMKKHGKPPAQVSVPRNLLVQHNRMKKELQRLLSTQESERQFRAWLFPRLAEMIGALSEAEQARPMSALVRGMQHKDWAQRVRCGTILAHVPGPKAAELFDAAMAGERDPYVLGELIRLRAGRRPDGLLEALTALLANEDWQVRSTVYAELRRVKKKETIDLLVQRLAAEEGRLRDDIVETLVVLTGKRLAADPEIWQTWWKQNRATWKPPSDVVKEDAGDGDADKDDRKTVSFYGIRTSSKRIVFCLDLSGSMAQPLDGEGGKKDARIVTARQQMERALQALPDDALFTIVTYSNTVDTWKKKLVKASDGNKKAAWRWVEKKEPAGSTNIYDALELSLRIATGGRGESADTIFFMTDGVPTDGRIVDPAQILTEITARNRRVGVVIHTIGVSEEQNAAFLLNLARANGGRYAAHK